MRVLILCALVAAAMASGYWPNNRNYYNRGYGYYNRGVGYYNRDRYWNRDGYWNNAGVWTRNAGTASYGKTHTTTYTREGSSSDEGYRGRYRYGSSSSEHGKGYRYGRDSSSSDDTTFTKTHTRTYNRAVPVYNRVRVAPVWNAKKY